MIAKCVEWIKAAFATERRRFARTATPAVVAHYWDGTSASAKAVRDVSQTGIFITTTEMRWSPGSLVMLSLQRSDKTDAPADAITIISKVVRWDDGGMALEFLPDPPQRQEKGNGHQRSDVRALKRFLQGIRKNDAQALVELALIVPFIFLLIANLVNFGGFFYAWITVADAARAGADYAVLGEIAAGSPTPATGAQILTVVQQDALSLPNRSTLVVNVCENDGITITTLSGTCSSTVPADPETNYVLSSVEVKYTYEPFIPMSFSFPNLNIYLTIPSTNIRRVAYMRVLQ